MTDWHALYNKPKFPRSAKYDSSWVLHNQMGPNALWFAEWISQTMNLKPGMRVLDLGCGKAMSSIFLAKEFGVSVWAADLWIDPDHNWKRVQEAGVEQLVYPFKAEAHALPFAKSFFDAVISIDAYQYFGTDEMYLDYLTRFVCPGGTISAVVVGTTQEIRENVPEHLTTPQSNGKVFWENGCRCFKTSEFWNDLWSRNETVTDVSVETLSDGWQYWRDFEAILEATGTGIFPSDREALEKDGGRYLGFMKLCAKRTGLMGENMYSPTIGDTFGINE